MAQGSTCELERANKEMVRNDEVDHEKKLRSFSGQLGVITRKLNQIKPLLLDRDNLPLVKEELELTSDRIDEFNLNVKTEIKRPDLQKNEQNKLNQWFEEKSKAVMSARKEISDWIRLGQDCFVDPGDSGSGRGSVRSYTSGRSSIRSNLSSETRINLAKEKARLAAEEVLEREMAVVEEEMASAERRRMQAQEERTSAERKARAVRNRAERVRLTRLEEEMNHIDDARSLRSGNSLVQREAGQSNAQPQAHIMLNDQIKLLAEMTLKSHLPKSEPEVFNGSDVTLFASFIQAFDRLVTCHTQSPSERLYYLEKYTTGEPRELVRSCLHMDPQTGYTEARGLLEKEYGNEFQVASSFLAKIQMWPEIRSDDGPSLKRFAIFLRGCQNYLTNVSALSQLNNPTQIQSIAKKLPLKLREGWRNRAFNLLEQNGFVLFKDLAIYVGRQADILCLPVFGDIKNDGERPSLSQRSTLSMATGTRHDRTVSGELSTCLYCNKTDHKLTDCFLFMKREDPEKTQFISEHRLCFGCLGYGHIARNCWNRSKCKTCGFNHPTCLHREWNGGRSEEETVLETNRARQRETKECVSACSLSDDPSNTFGRPTVVPRSSPRVALSVIPVKVKLRGQTKFVITYAGLDNFSSDCFVTDEVLEKLGIQGQNTEIRLSTMNCKDQRVLTRAVQGLELMDLSEDEMIPLPVTYSRPELPVTNSDIFGPEDVGDWTHLSGVPFLHVDAGVGLLLGANAPEAIKPLEIISGPSNSPYASRHRLGWALSGPLNNPMNGNQVHVNRTHVDHGDIGKMVRNMYNLEFSDSGLDEKGTSIEDKKWKEKIGASIRTNTKGFYEIALPFRESTVSLPCNRSQAIQRVESIRRKLQRDQKFREDYCGFMSDMLSNDFAEVIPPEELRPTNARIWYIAHHGVYHKKKNTIRVVFNCSLKYKGVSLNDLLLQGPDLTNNLLGVLIRFREGRIAFTGDIAKMFYQVKVPLADSDVLRFFWFPNGDLTLEPQEYRLKVHVFGAVSSPSCANFALHQAACDTREEVSEEAFRTLHDCFYVDDLLKSVDSIREAISLISELKYVCNKGNFDLTQFNSNNREVLNSLSGSDLTKGVRELDLEWEELPTDRALGVTWKIGSDSFGFNMKEQGKMDSRRGILSAVHAIYDPFGFVGPAVLSAKLILQELCRRNIGWDSPMPGDLEAAWDRWKNELCLLGGFEIPRWIRTSRNDSWTDLHFFCDGSEVGYGAVAYVRVQDASGMVSTNLMLAKSRLAPLKKLSIPRLELAGAKLAVEVASIIRKEKSIPVRREVFWTDSQTVLKYLRNERKRFQRYVANRVAYIHERSNVNQWRHVPGPLNPADVASRSQPIRDFVGNSTWKYGPPFLSQDDAFWPNGEQISELEDNDPEVAKERMISAATLTKADVLLQWIEGVSSWERTKAMVSGLIKLQHKIRGQTQESEPMEEASVAIIKKIQDVQFGEIVRRLQSGIDIGRKNQLRKLSPFLDPKGLLRVGGRVHHAKDLSNELRHPIIIPKGHIANLLVRETHLFVGHLGQQSMIASLRGQYRIIADTSLVKRVIRECVHCKKYQGKVIDQYMAALPPDRLKSDLPPFTNTGVDMFGPFQVTRGRNQIDRYGLVFSCLSSRAIHLEVVYDKTTDSFIQSLRRFIARRGQVRVMRSDNGTNFVGADRELKKLLKELDQSEVSREMELKNIQWIFNPPYAHYYGGAWEREIRTVRKVMAGLLNEQSRSLTDESLNTLMCEVEAILNSRPLTPCSDDPLDLEAITPNHLLLLKSGPSFPPGLFEQSDVYARKRWKQVQYLADLFWTRWKREYLGLLMQRQKWTKVKRNVQVGDLVLLVTENTPRYRWPLARVVEVCKSEDDMVRKVFVKTSSGRYFRPVSQLIMVLEGNGNKGNENDPANN